MSAGRVIKIILIAFIIALCVAGIKGIDIYRKAFTANVIVDNPNGMYFYISSIANYEEVLEQLDQEGLLKNFNTFNWTARRKNYQNHIKPGRYLVKNRMSNNDLVNMFRSGKQEAVELSFNNVNTIKDLSRKIAKQLEFSADDLMALLSDSAVLQQHDFTPYTIPAMFIPNTYKVYWNTAPEAFVKRMHKEYQSFWNKSRTAKAEKMGMTPLEVITLASIVNKEVRFDKEKKTVAGLYINRINKGIRLQADPTLIFAMGDFSIRRVLNKHKRLNSPYNTYKYSGLPPGPICIPDISSIDAVLNYEKHKYIYMCAKPDFSGYHNFAKTLKQHNRNAEAYRRELNKRRIYN